MRDAIEALRAIRELAARRLADLPPSLLLCRADMTAIVALADTALIPGPTEDLKELDHE
jgi:hypothetical protein